MMKPAFWGMRPTQKLKPGNHERQAINLELNNKRVVVTGGSRLVDGGATTSLQI
jgi:hypothetical protein